MKLVQPKTYLLGYTGVDEQELIKYLQETDQEEFSEFFYDAKKAGLSTGQILCSFYGKLCYKSLVLGKNLNVSRIRDIENNIKGCFDTKHGSIFEHFQLNWVTTNCSRIFCYTPETEVLTKDGWINITKLNNNSILATLNPHSNKVEWEINKKLHKFNYDGEIIRWKTSQFISPGFTPDHIQWIARYDKRVNRNKNVDKISNFEKLTTNAIYQKRFVIKHNIELLEEDVEDIIKIGNYEYDAKKLFRFIGWMITDGTISKSKNYCSVIQLKHTYLNELSKLFTDLFGNRWKKYDTEYRIYDKNLKEWLVNKIGREKQHKRLYKLFSYSKELLNELFIGGLHGDGNTHKNGHSVIYCGYLELAKDWQVILSRIGYSSNVREDYSRIGTTRILNGNIIKNNLPSYVVSIHKKKQSLINKKHQFVEKYRGNVYCPETNNGIIFVRNKGMSFWSGNTHELVRHRAGTAFSQTSGRYVSIDSLDMVIDPILSPVLDEISELCITVEEKLRLIRKKLIEDKNITDFATKKKITSAIRRLAPNGQSNEIGWSCNIRSLRHMIEMRTSRHAEWEIRLIFNQVADIVQAKFPLMLYGANVEEVDGMNEYTGLRV